LRITGFVWLEQYVEKLAWKHDVTPEEVEAMLSLKEGILRVRTCIRRWARQRRGDTSSPSSFINRMDVH
jgi:hypothetical protein